MTICTDHAEMGINITPITTVTKWHGEYMDDQMAVEALLRRDKLN